MRIKIYLNRTYLHTANLITLELDARSFRVNKNNEEKNYITIDGITYVDENNIINSIEFLHYGYISSIELNNTNIYTTSIEYTKNLCFKDFASCVKFIKTL